ncbi:MAG: MlrC C-terminal domain-containing protein, partial [Saccharofermentanales bacterium]
TVLTAEYPMKSVMESAERLQVQNDFFDVSVFPGQSWVDCEHSGASVVITSYIDIESLKKAYDSAYKIAEDFWNVRGSFKFDQNALFPAQAVQAAWNCDKNLTFLSDSGDNPTAGASGKRTDLLIEMQDHTVRNSVFGAVWDKDFAAFFWDKDIGYKNEMRLGENAQDRLFRFTLKYKGRILNWDGADGGRSVLVNTEGIDVIVTENRISIISPEIFSSTGVDIRKYRIIAVKLGYLYPKLAKVASTHYLALTNGESCVNIESLHFRNLGRPVYPIDKNAAFHCRKIIL